MSSGFDPDANAQANGTWDTTFLSDRDVSSQVPINFVPHPGVYVTAACFGNNVYDDAAAQNCMSNLLLSQIRRYVVDLYWDATNRRFGLCPIQIPASASNTSQIASSDGSTNDQYTITSGSLRARQATLTTAANITSPLTSSTTISTAVPTYSVISTKDGSSLLQLGPYQCSNTLTLASFTSVLERYLSSTSNTIDAKVLVLILNLRVAPALGMSGSQAQLSASQLPTMQQSVGTNLDALDDALYKPGTLLSDRQDLNSSWYRPGNTDYLPLDHYFSSFKLSSGDLATEDGWPNEDYILITKGRRMLVGLGDLEPSISKYNFSMDGDRVYPPNYLVSSVNATYNTTGELSQGCYFNGTDYDVSQLNNSWAVATINTINPPYLDDAADNLTACGISQLLNVTINSITADVAVGPYQDYGNNAVFSWAYDEPQNDSSRHTNEAAKFRCALMISDSSYRGHWRTEFCSQKYRAACREAQSPYRWQISEHAVPYGSGDAACTGNTTFDVPRTGLENKYLYAQVQSESGSDASVLDGIWINFNSLQVESCWITTGLNGSCPYILDASATHSRQILIPTIAALIVLLLTVLTILVKCSANARNSRIRRRGEGGWDYEGVPS